MHISKEEDKIHKALRKSQEKILDKMAQIEMDIHHHHIKHGGDIGFIDAFKNLGNTIKSGFEDKIIHPVEDLGNQIKSGFEDKIIHPFEDKIISPVQQQINSLPQKTQDIINKLPDKIKNSPQFQQTIDFITKKKGGLASSLLHNGLPAFTSALGGATATLLAPEAGPLAGIAGSTAGGYAGKELSDYIGNKTGVGLKRKMKGKGYGGRKPTAGDQDWMDKHPNRGYNNTPQSNTPPPPPAGLGLRKKKMKGRGTDPNIMTPSERASFQKALEKSDRVHRQRIGMPPKPIDVPVNQVNNIPQGSGGGIRKKKSKKYYSSSSDSDSDYRPKRKSNNSALQQLLVANRDAEEKELKKSQLMLNRHMVEEMKAIRNARPIDQQALQKVTPYPVGGRGIKKLVGTKKGNRARGDIVAEVMKKHGLSLGEASKYVSKNNLY